MALGIPLKDGSGKGVRANEGRGGCDPIEGTGKGIEMSVEKRGNKWCVVHGEGPDKGKVIKCWDNEDDAKKQHAAITTKKSQMSVITSNEDFVELEGDYEHPRFSKEVVGKVSSLDPFRKAAVLDSIFSFSTVTEMGFDPILVKPKPGWKRGHPEDRGALIDGQVGVVIEYGIDNDTASAVLEVRDPKVAQEIRDGIHRKVSVGIPVNASLEMNTGKFDGSYLEHISLTPLAYDGTQSETFVEMETGDPTLLEKLFDKLGYVKKSNTTPMETCLEIINLKTTIEEETPMANERQLKPPSAPPVAMVLEPPEARPPRNGGNGNAH